MEILPRHPTPDLTQEKLDTRYKKEDFFTSKYIIIGTTYSADSSICDARSIRRRGDLEIDEIAQTKKDQARLELQHGKFYKIHQIGFAFGPISSRKFQIC